MSNHIFEEGPRRGHAAGNSSLEQQASQLTSDIKYKARQKMKGTSGSSMSPGQVQQLYRQLLGSSSAPGGVKAIVKKKLFKEQIDTGVVSVSEHVKDSSSYVYSRVFSEAEERKFVVRVTDRETGNTSYRKADRAKISELRANKNISSVEITGRKEVDDAYKGDPKPNYGEKHEKKYGSSKGKNTVGDKDGDGTKEPDRHEYAGVKDRAIKKSMAKEEYLDEMGKSDQGVRDRIAMFKNSKIEYTPPTNWDKDANRGKGATVSPKQAEKRRRKSLRQEEYIDEAPYQVMGSPDGKKEKKIGKPVKSRKYADSRAAELADTHKTTGGQYRSKYVEEVEQIDEVIGAVAKVAALGARGAAKAATLAAKGAVKAAPVVAKAAKVAGKGVVKGAKAVNKVGKKVGRAVDTADKAADVALKVKKLEKRENANEEVIYEKDDNGDKKLDVMKKGKNTVKINPSLGESIRAELDLLKAQRIAEQDASMKQQDDESKNKELADKQAKKDKMMRIRILRNKMLAVRQGTEVNASHKLEGDTIAEDEGMMRYCPACDKDETREECKAGGEYWDENSKPAKNEEDPRSMPTKINLAKNKLRAMGLKMSYDMEGDMVEGLSVEDQMKVSAKHNRENPRKPYKLGDGYARNVKDAASNAARKPKDTRTSQQRMNDAVGKSRPGESD